MLSNLSKKEPYFGTNAGFTHNEKSDILLLADRLNSFLPGHLMKNEEYEKAYYDAREILHNRGKKISSPLFGPNLIRSCIVDGFSLSDYDLLKEAWGEMLAQEILRELAESDSLPNCCPEGNRLWQEYSDSMRLNLEILIKQQSAANKQDVARVAQLAPSLLQAAEVRLHNRRSLLEHAAVHIPAVH